MLPSPLHLLLIEDDPDHAALVRRHLRDSDLGPVVIEHADQLGGGLSLLRSRHVDAVISDMHLPDGDFRSALPEVVRLAGDAPLIVLTSLDDQQLATTAVQLGAQDYLIKSQLTADSLTRSIRYAIHRKRTEADLRRSEERLRLAMSASHSGTFRWDLQTNAVEWDDATYEVFGVERGSVRNIEDSLRTIHPEDVAVIRELLSKRQDNSELHLEFRICEPSGKTRWLVSKGCMIHRDGSPSYIIGAVTDITAQKQAMEQLRELNDNLEARIYERTRSLVRYQERLRALTSELTLTEQRERRRLAPSSTTTSPNCWSSPR
jgi:PAS domain S-box-containing protein